MKLLVIEDDPKTASLMQKGLTAEGFNVEVSYDGEDGLEQIAIMQPDAIILDVMLPKKDGWQVLSELRLNGNGVPVLMLTARDAVEHRVKGLTLGADDYITKPFALSELIARIRSVLRRSQSRSNDEIRFADLVLDPRRHKASRACNPVELTIKEFTLLQLLLEHQGDVLTRSFIAERIWGIMYEGDSNVVDVNIRRLRTKIDDPFPQKLIHTVRGRGYVIRQ